MPPSIMTTVIDTPSKPANPIQEEICHTIRTDVIMAGGDILKQSAIDLARGPLLSFLQRTRAVERFGPHLPDPAVDRRVREVIQSWELGIAPHKLEIPIKTGVTIGAMSYRHTSFEVQVAVALFCFTAVCFDDKIIDAQARREFLPRYYHNQPQLHILLDKFLESAHTLGRLVPSYGANIIFTGLLEYCNEDILHSDQPVVASHSLKKQASNYVEYVRMIDGIPGPFVVAIWPESLFPDVKEYVQALPDAYDWGNIGNDLLSFYKEALAGESDNFVNIYARLHGKTLHQTLEDIVDRLVQRDETVRAILGEGKARDAWDSFTSGYIQFHLIAPRYKLNESAVDLVRGPILSFLQRTHAVERFGPHLPDPVVDKKVREAIQSWELDIAPHKLEIPIKAGVNFGAMAYRRTPFEVQVAVALFCFATVCFDDSDAQGRREFLPRYYHNQPRLHVLLDKILESTHALRRFVPSYSANIILTGLLEYCNEDVVYSDESDIASQDLKKEARNYSYVRMNDGIPGPFIIPIWPESLFPDMKEYFQVLPDAYDWANVTK
ncbi:hypothetical protein QCA50_013242 [Cerrena zonata]|uniref:Uncharacterized protein n=1 Tax=Cerrena zonata TaxID=2478898 RepID=A0AAW0FWR3_9APHY